jgi:hypothetical protein
LIDKRYKDEPTGEVQTLVGKLEGSRMGDKYDSFLALSFLSFIAFFSVIFNLLNFISLRRET